jgi:hypothetical protein
LGGAAESLRRLAGTKPGDAYNVLLTATNAKKGIGSIKAILPEAQMYWNALFVNMLPDQQRVVAPFAQ